MLEILSTISAILLIILFGCALAYFPLFFLGCLFNNLNTPPVGSDTWAWPWEERDRYGIVKKDTRLKSRLKRLVRWHT